MGEASASKGDWDVRVGRQHRGRASYKTGAKQVSLLRMTECHFAWPGPKKAPLQTKPNT